MNRVAQSAAVVEAVKTWFCSGYFKLVRFTSSKRMWLEILFWLDSLFWRCTRNVSIVVSISFWFWRGRVSNQPFKRREKNERNKNHETFMMNGLNWRVIMKFFCGFSCTYLESALSVENNWALAVYFKSFKYVCRYICRCYTHTHIHQEGRRVCVSK